MREIELEVDVEKAHIVDNHSIIPLQSTGLIALISISHSLTWV
jgi:hypothetical protein